MESSGSQHVAGKREMNKEEIIDRILASCDRDGAAVVSKAYEDGGIDSPFPRLRRAAVNQIDNGDAVFSRYAIWANTVRDNIRQAIDLLEQSSPKEARRLLVRAINSLSAFAEIQALCDPMRIGHLTMDIDDEGKAGG